MTEPPATQDWRPTLRLRAHAKVNLALEVLGRRPDGFHEIVSVTQAISIHDVVEAEDADTLRVELRPPLVRERENLAWRAAETLAMATGRRPAAVLRIWKRIPLAAGLGGGSTDAAAALRLLDRLWATGLGPDALASIAVTLGSDVPLFLAGGTCLIRGRGEVVERLPPAPTFWLVLVPLPLAPPDKTRVLYGALHPDAWSDGARALALAERIRRGERPTDADLVNAFDAAADAVYPDFAALRRRLSDAVGAPLHLTGAGPSLFALAPSRQAAAAASARVRALGLSARVAQSVARRPSIEVVNRPRPGAAR